jgi:hypothetical protein
VTPALQHELLLNAFGVFLQRQNIDFLLHVLKFFDATAAYTVYTLGDSAVFKVKRYWKAV